MHVIRVLGKLEPGGAQLALLRLSAELDRRHGVRTTLLVGDATEEGLRLAQRYDVQTIAFRTAFSFHPLRNLQWQLSTEFASWLSDKLTDADLVHAHMVGAWWAVGQVIGSTPFVATEHNEVNWSSGRVRALQPVAARVDRFYAMGPSARQFAVDAGVGSDVIRHARSPVAGLDTAAGSGLPSPRLTFAGRFSSDKGPDVLIEALAILDRPDVAAYLLGDGPMRPALVAEVERRGLAGRVFAPGWVDNPWTYIAGSTVHVVPSREEAWSQSAVLALGLGVPVIGTEVDGLIGTLSDARGLTVAADDPQALAAAIAQVLGGSTTIDSAAGLSYAREFTPARVADFYLADYADLVNAPSMEWTAAKVS
ncbi:glycosyltransferase [Jatrophihabitans sp. DSM 45814]